MFFLATNSIGAVWSSTSPDFGVKSVIDRFQQIDPKVLFCVDGYQYQGKSYDRSNEVSEIIDSLPTLNEIVVLPYLNKDLKWPNTTPYSNITERSSSELTFTRVDFNDPIWILYSSGTTGLPKPITHGVGGILLEHLKYLTFHQDVQKGDRCFWFTTTGWMMWNYVNAALLSGGVVVQFDGSPGYPDMNAMWKLAQDFKITHMGVSAGFITASMKSAVEPSKTFELSALRSIGSTGSPLPPEGFKWLYENVKSDLWLTSISGGSDVCTAFVGGNPLLPVYKGEIQCRALGAKLESWDENGSPITNEVGEMVITAPMPCMPVYFWNDPEFERYSESYFEMFPGVWRHGDWIELTDRGGIIIYGRSDSTLNRGGVRIGTSEIYRTVESIEKIKDSLIICLENQDGEFYMPLFVVCDQLDNDLISEIKREIRTQYSPRHVPDDIIQAPEIPYTISGKKVELPVKKVLSGKARVENLNLDALKNPTSMNFYQEFYNNKDFSWKKD